MKRVGLHLQPDDNDNNDHNNKLQEEGIVKQEENN